MSDTVVKTSGEAVCFCVFGALQAVGATGQDRHIRSAAPDGWQDFVSAYNDAETTTHADIMALFDRAIALAGSGE